MRKFNSICLWILLSFFMTGCTLKYQGPESVPQPVPAPVDNYIPPKQTAYVPPVKRQEIYPKIYKPVGEKPLLIVIDPGHGGEDLGTTSPFVTTFHEKAANLLTAQILQTLLQQMGFRTLMTRNNDFFVSLQGRSQFANQQNGDLFVSVHYNSAPAASAHGVEVFYFNSQENKTRSAASKELAKDILDQVITLTGAKSRGVKHGNLAVIRETKMPAILIEGGFFTNKEEFSKLRDTAYLRKIAWGIAQGVREYSLKK